MIELSLMTYFFALISALALLLFISLWSLCELYMEQRKEHKQLKADY